MRALRQFWHSLDDRKNVWRINMWIGSNHYRIFWIILTIAVALQQSRSTEPLAFGFFWISIGAHILATAWGTGSERMRDRSVLLQAFAFQLGGVVLQIWIAWNYWPILLQIDEVARMFRAQIFAWYSPDHRLLGWVVWLIATVILLQSIVMEAGGKFWFNPFKKYD